jgi:hypothetical protein
MARRQKTAKWRKSKRLLGIISRASSLIRPPIPPPVSRSSLTQDQQDTIQNPRRSPAQFNALYPKRSGPNASTQMKYLPPERSGYKPLRYRQLSGQPGVFSRRIQVAELYYRCFRSARQSSWVHPARLAALQIRIWRAHGHTRESDERRCSTRPQRIWLSCRCISWLNRSRHLGPCSHAPRERFRRVRSRIATLSSRAQPMN